ncbi:MAG: hypothetical protein KBT39_02595 [Bacteroidales bacterium]|nr:hypothetical protein [Bacteroidales bacterium]
MVVKKTTTAKKTTAAKPAAKKTTAAKPAAKKTTTAAKPAAKKTTAAKPAEKVGGEITVSGNKLMKTLQTQFSKKFEYLLLCFIIDADRTKSVNVKCINTSKTISAARKKPSDKELSMHGRSKVQSIEDFFWKELGIACQIGISNYSGHVLYFPLGSFNDMTLTAANEWAKKMGCSKISTALINKASQGYVF